MFLKNFLLELFTIGADEWGSNTGRVPLKKGYDKFVDLSLKFKRQMLFQKILMTFFICGQFSGGFNTSFQYC